MPVSRVSRLLTGPEILGSRPVVATFDSYKDKVGKTLLIFVCMLTLCLQEDVLRTAGLLRGSSVHVTEDMNRKTRESRTELRRFMRAVKRANPGLQCVLQYDKLLLDNKVFVWSEAQGRVVEQVKMQNINMKLYVEQGGIEGPGPAVSPCPCSRPGSVLTDSGFHSVLSNRSPVKTPKVCEIRKLAVLNHSSFVSFLTIVRGRICTARCRTPGSVTGLSWTASASGWAEWKIPCCRTVDL